MVIKHCGKKIIRRTYSVKISGKMKIYILHRNYLCVSSACRTAFNAENGTERGLSKSYRNLFPYSVQSVGKSDSSCCFALACRCGSYGGNKHELGVLFIPHILKERKVKLRLYPSVLLYIFLVDTGFPGYFENILRCHRLCYFYIRKHHIHSLFL